MVNRPKAKGTKREVLVRDRLLERGLYARRSETNAPGRDIDVVGDVLRIIEVKDRQQLNIHKVLAHTIRHNPGVPAAVVWHRTSRKGDNSRLTPDGPTIVALPLDDYIDLLAVAAAAADVEANLEDVRLLKAIRAITGEQA